MKATIAPQVLGNFPSVSMSQWTHTNHKPIILLYDINIITPNYGFSKHIESLQTCISMASLLGANCRTLLAML